MGSALTTSLDFDSVVVEARERSGLEDLGAGCDEPLRILLKSLDKEANLNDVGRVMQRERTVNILIARARLEDWWTRHPEIANEEIGAPLVVCGLPRTGTTMLHRVIAEDPDFDSAKWYEVRYPAPFEGWQPGGDDARIVAAKEEVRMTLEMAPELMAIHPFDATSPDEEIMLLEQAFYSGVPDSYCRVPGYAKWVEAQDQMPGYVYLKRMVQFLQWQHRQAGGVRPRWTLKAPHHLHYLKELFEVFPGAQVVQTHREPSQSIASICSLNEKLLSMGSDEPDLLWTGDHWSAKWARALQRAMDYRDGAAENRVIDIWFLDSVRDPIGTVRRVYEHLGRKLSPIAEGKMRKWTEENAREKRAPHAYKLEDFGLSEERIHREFAAYRERYILPRQAAE